MTKHPTVALQIQELAQAFRMLSGNITDHNHLQNVRLKLTLIRQKLPRPRNNKDILNPLKITDELIDYVDDLLSQPPQDNFRHRFDMGLSAIILELYSRL